MSDEIRPVMTATEWAMLRSMPVHATPELLATTVASANDALPADHPLKLTREDVRLLRGIHVADPSGDASAPDPDLARLAAKLAALLPPDA